MEMIAGIPQKRRIFAKANSFPKVEVGEKLEFEVSNPRFQNIEHFPDPLTSRRMAELENTSFTCGCMSGYAVMNDIIPPPMSRVT